MVSHPRERYDLALFKHSLNYHIIRSSRYSSGVETFAMLSLLSLFVWAGGTSARSAVPQDTPRSRPRCARVPSGSPASCDTPSSRDQMCSLVEALWRLEEKL